jgi:hypothetical protein
MRGDRIERAQSAMVKSLARRAMHVSVEPREQPNQNFAAVAALRARDLAQRTRADRERVAKRQKSLDKGKKKAIRVGLRRKRANRGVHHGRIVQAQASVEEPGQRLRIAVPRRKRQRPRLRPSFGREQRGERLETAASQRRGRVEARRDNMRGASREQRAAAKAQQLEEGLSLFAGCGGLQKPTAIGGRNASRGARRPQAAQRRNGGDGAARVPGLKELGALHQPLQGRAALGVAPRRARSKIEERAHRTACANVGRRAQQPVEPAASLDPRAKPACLHGEKRPQAGLAVAVGASAGEAFQKIVAQRPMLIGEMPQRRDRVLRVPGAFEPAGKPAAVDIRGRDEWLSGWARGHGAIQKWAKPDVPVKRLVSKYKRTKRAPKRQARARSFETDRAPKIEPKQRLAGAIAVSWRKKRQAGGGHVEGREKRGAGVNDRANKRAELRAARDAARSALAQALLRQDIVQRVSDDFAAFDEIFGGERGQTALGAFIEHAPAEASNLLDGLSIRGSVEGVQRMAAAGGSARAIFLSCVTNLRWVPEERRRAMLDFTGGWLAERAARENPADRDGKDSAIGVDRRIVATVLAYCPEVSFARSVLRFASPFGERPGAERARATEKLVAALSLSADPWLRSVQQAQHNPWIAPDAWLVFGLALDKMAEESAEELGSQARAIARKWIFGEKGRSWRQKKAEAEEKGRVFELWQAQALDEMAIRGLLDASLSSEARAVAAELGAPMRKSSAAWERASLLGAADEAGPAKNGAKDASGARRV